MQMCNIVEKMHDFVNVYNDESALSVQMQFL